MNSFIDLNTQIKDGIKTGNADVVGKVVTKAVDDELTRRAELIAKGRSLFISTERELKKIKPDNVQLDADGNEVSATYTKATVESEKKLEKKLDDLNAALVDAISNADYQKLERQFLDFWIPGT